MQPPNRHEAARRQNLARPARKSNTPRPALVIEPQRIFELGNGLEIWKVNPSSLRDQDVKARSMPKAMFERLAHVRYEGGSTAYLEVLANETNYLAAELALSQARLNEMLSLVQIYSALGGGWQQ
jgi:hypothetical protein